MSFRETVKDSNSIDLYGGNKVIFPKECVCYYNREYTESVFYVSEIKVVTVVKVINSICN